MKQSMPQSVCPRCHEARLYRLKDGGFWITKEGALTPVLTGFRYILATQRFVGVLGAFRMDGWRVRSPARIWDPVASRQIDDYVELEIDDEVTPRNVYAFPTEGARVWHYDRCGLYVSPAVRDGLAMEFPDLEFRDASWVGSDSGAHANQKSDF